MSEFTDQDRERAQKTLTLVEQQGIINDERHDHVLGVLKDHEVRIRKSEGFRNRIIGWAVGAGLLSAGIAEVIKAKIGA